MSRNLFRKYHGLGNDFIVFDGLSHPLPLQELGQADVAARLCHRHTGIGADGLLLIDEPQTAEAQARMRVINADGSEPEMCGNGIRCVAKALHDHVDRFRGLSRITIDTGAGPLQCELTVGEDRLVRTVRVDMGRPSLDRKDLPMQGQDSCIDELIDLPGQALRWTAVSMGNPHIVAFVDVDEPSGLRALTEKLGPLMETHSLFPNRTNVELVRLAANGPQRGAAVWVWERGCGITQACGTGACAVAVAAVATRRHSAGDPLEVHLPGGTLIIEVAADMSRVWMEGPAEEVFRGEVWWGETP